MEVPEDPAVLFGERLIAVPPIELAEYACVGTDNDGWGPQSRCA